MFNFLWSKLKFQAMTRQERHSGEDREEERCDALSEQLSENLSLLEGIIGGSPDVVIREFLVGGERPSRAALVFISGLTDDGVINENVLKPLMQNDSDWDTEETESSLFRVARERLLTVGTVEEVGRVSELIDGYLSGDAALLLDGCARALLINCRSWEKRGIERPQNESVIRGPLESFNEDLFTNISLMRRKIQNPNLQFELQRIGRKTRTRVALLYVKGVADEALVGEVRRRLAGIRMDSILESGYIEQMIEDAPYSLFPTVGNTEKPDVLAAKILEGRVGILVDGSPFALSAPLLFVEFFQAGEDYYNRHYQASIIRIFRYTAAALSILLPSLYVALTTFHQELIPTPLLFTMAASREGVPFPAVLEAAVMVVLFEILKEAGIRLPNPVGQAISIVGALIIGESAVSAGLIGAPMVIIISLTAVSGFIVYALDSQVSTLRMIYLFLAGVLGGFGITMGLLGLLIHLSSLRSFGYPYLSPVAPFDAQGMKDTVWRAPLWKMKRRPNQMAPGNETRQNVNAPPDSGSQKQSAG